MTKFFNHYLLSLFVLKKMSFVYENACINKFYKKNLQVIFFIIFFVA